MYRQGILSRQFFSAAIFLALLTVHSLLPHLALAQQEECRLLGVDQAVSLALESNPGLKAIEARYRAMKQVPSQAASLPDPKLGINFLNFPTDTFSLDQEAMTQVQIKVTQSFPFPGKLSIKREIAQLGSDSASDMVEQEKLRLARDVKAIWWRLVSSKVLLEILREGEGLIRQAVDVAMVKYKVGQGLQQDVLLAKVELDRIHDKETALEGEIEGLKARLAALMDLPNQWCVDAQVPEGVELPSLGDKEFLIARAFASNPRLKSAEKRLKAAEKGIELAKKGLLPDFSLGAAYGFRQGRDNMGRERPDFATFTFSMNLPLWAGSKQLPAVRQKVEEAAQAREEMAELRNRLRGDILRLYERYSSIARQAGLYSSEIVPSAQQTAASMLAAYRVNKVDFLNVVRAELAFLNYRMELWRLYAQAHEVLADLEMNVGGPVIE